MRQIKVRGLVIESLVSGEKWITSDEEYHEVYLNYAECSAYINGHAVVWESVSEYTGLKDKNGKEIYEGDIIRNDRGTILKVPFVDGAFYAEGTDALSKQYVFSVLSDFSSWSEVVGNIYENPELLEESK